MTSTRIVLAIFVIQMEVGIQVFSYFFNIKYYWIVMKKRIMLPKWMSLVASSGIPTKGVADKNFIINTQAVLHVLRIQDVAP